MINYGEYDIQKIPDCTNEKILFRVAYKKEQDLKALDFCKELKAKGYGVFINPMHTSIYTCDELLKLIANINIISPYGFTVTDTTGSMTEKDVISIFSIIDKNLDSGIKLCFHSHNNLQLSFAHVQSLVKLIKSRELIVDATLSGMGRGAGNLCTELIVKYLKDNYDNNYDLIPILRSIDTKISPILKNNYWGYSIPYYLTAINHCHPNYAKYMIEKYSASNECIRKVIALIPQEFKTNFNSQIIDEIYNSYI